MSTDHDLDRLLALAEGAARDGGRVVAASFGGARDVRQKAPGDWVSEVDLASEEAVRTTLERGAPGIAFFGEEGGGTRARTGWFVDPLDGTTNFLHGFEAVGVSVALVDDGVPVVGVVHAPLLGRTWTARLGGGTSRDGVPSRVSRRGAERAVVATGLPFRRADLAEPYLDAFGAAFRSFEDLRRVGAACLDLAWTASGVFDGFFELALGTWDVAAGGLLVREAGGVVTDWSGDERAWLDSGDVVAGPPELHDRILETLATVASR